METPPSDSGTAHADETKRGVAPAGEARTRHGSGRFWIVSAVLGIVMLVGLTPVALTATPRQCALCHEMRPYYDSWQASSHRAAVRDCLECHTKPGVLNQLSFEFGAYHMVFAHFAGTPVRSTAANAPAVESCLRSGCHSLNREVSNSADLKINHRLHVTTAHIACPTCHAGAVHAGVGGRLKLPPMKVCKQCHADKMTDCSYCHIQEHLQAAPGTH